MKALRSPSVPLLLTLLLGCGKAPSPAPEPPQPTAPASPTSPPPETTAASQDANAAEPAHEADAAQPAQDGAVTPDAAQPAAGTPDTAPSPDTAPEPAPTAPTITLLQPGEAPRHRIRYALPPTPSPTTLPLRLALDFSATSDGQPMKLPLPPLSLIIASTPKPDALTLGVTRVEVGDGAPPHLAEFLRSLNGLSGERPFSPRGLLPTTTPLFPPPATAALGPLLEGFSQAMEQLIVPLPDEPIGPGARWLQRLPVTQHGVTFEQLTTWTLVSRADGALSLAYTVELRLGDSPERRLSPPQSPLEGTIESVDGRGTGTVMLALGATKDDALHLPSPLPLRVTGDHTLSLALEISAPSPGAATPKRLTIQSRLSLSTDDTRPD